MSETLTLSRFTAEGLARFAAFLQRRSQDRGATADLELLADPRYAEPLPGQIQVSRARRFESRQEVAQAVSELTEPLPKAGRWRRDTGFWAWLACCWFDGLCPPGRNPGALARWIPEYDNPRRYYRHLVLGPWLILRAHRDRPERAAVLLCQRPWIHPDTAEQLASRMNLIPCKAVVQSATDLYYDPARHNVVRGATARDPASGLPALGTLRRLVDVCLQFDLTYDLFAMTAVTLQSLLPPEFEPFLEGARRRAGGE